ncbi:MAG TPA: hypothetical protein PLA27_05735 [Anaerolineales bacterium]|jgi:hypothetical protein|nr:hypothetical protein [Anaerolineales bacterium]HQX15904.1 hypothetical protein [Anaerolineales bacterium]
MSRFPWGVFLALLLGFGAGLAYAWVISPLQVVDAVPSALRDDFKDQYRSAIAAAYAGAGNIERAQARLALLGDTNSIEALNAQAQRLLANGEFQSADQVVLLSAALQGNGIALVPPPSTPSMQLADIQPSLPPSTLSPIPTSPTQEIFTSTPEVTPTQTFAVAATPRPTQTPIPTIGVSFKLIAQESLCDSNLPDGLLQVLVLNSNRRQMPGMGIRITWETNEDRFFTGLKPELGNGYADFLMTPNIAYSVQLAQGSDVASGLIAPACQTSSGEHYSGGFKLTFQQPK